MKTTLKLTEIKLDEKNPRYATRKNKEQNVANFMIKHTKSNYIDDMVKDIATHGLNPLDVIGVFKEGDEFIALDGNRRILALKILFDNKNITLTSSLKSIINQSNLLSKKNIPVNKIEVYLFSDRQNAKKWLDRKHTSDFGGASHQDWPTLEKKIFQDNPLALLISENADDAGILYDDYAINIKYSIWERFFGSGFSREWLGVSYNKDDKKYKVVNKKQLHERMRVIVQATHDKKLNYQNVIKKTGKSKIIKYMNETYLTDSPYKKIWSFKSQAKPNSHKRKAPIKNMVILKKYVSNKKILNVLKQIDKINLDNYTELVSLSIRPLIEISCWAFLVSVMKKSNNWLNSHSLKEWIIETIKKLKDDGYARENKTTMKFIEKTVDEFILVTNGDIHDIKFFSTPKELKANLERVTIFLEETWKKIN